MAREKDVRERPTGIRSRPEHVCELDGRMFARDLQASSVKDQLEFITEALKRKTESKRNLVIIPQ